MYAHHHADNAPQMSVDDALSNVVRSMAVLRDPELEWRMDKLMMQKHADSFYLDSDNWRMASSSECLRRAPHSFLIISCMLTPRLFSLASRHLRSDVHHPWLWDLVQSDLPCIIVQSDISTASAGHHRARI